MLQQIATTKSDIAAFTVEVSDETMAKLQNSEEFASMLAKENALHNLPNKGAEVEANDTSKPAQVTVSKSKSKNKNDTNTADVIPSEKNDKNNTDLIGGKHDVITGEESISLENKNNVVKQQVVDEQQILLSNDVAKSTGNEASEKIKSEVNVEVQVDEANGIDLETIDTKRDTSTVVTASAVTLPLNDDGVIDGQEDNNGTHWLSIVEKLVASSLGDDSDVNQVLATDEKLTPVLEIDNTDLLNNVENSKQTALQTLMSKINSMAVEAKDVQQGSNDVDTFALDENSEMLALLENNPQLLEALKQLLSSQEKMAVDPNIEGMDSNTQLHALLNNVSLDTELEPDVSPEFSDEVLTQLADDLFTFMDSEKITSSTEESPISSVSSLDSVEQIPIENNLASQSSIETKQSDDAVIDISLANSNSATVDSITVVHEGELTQQELALLESNPELQTLLQLPPDKLDRALSLLAKQFQQLNGTGTEKDASVQEIKDVKSSAASDLTMLRQTADSDGLPEFVIALKAGLAEVKVQLENGREPRIDLKGLVNDAIKASPELASNMLSVKPEQVELATRSVLQVLDVAQLMSTALEQSAHQQSVSTTYREQGINMVEHSKASQLQQGQLDKSLNLAKPEAHQQLAEKVRFMVNTNQLVADIRLDPAELGSMHVKVTITGESANVSFVVQSAHAKEAIDNAAPRLKEMLAEKGIELGQSSVEQESKEQHGEQHMAGQRDGTGTESGLTEADVPEGVLQQPIVNGALGGIDYFV
ncbi:flagellar hook-length control protein FliK [uncultured Paraglaciecola sp.]|uniref:flagellar hook-length control protein FliK n=1 Tax=uncultured Paraglaciecola sp. TaxID=1765024 RepID=UPI0030DBF8B0|tara:strand:+ start:10819 stop:13113 length:2295 start_codon:yes stop_codon:yes gene_type:complete